VNVRSEEKSHAGRPPEADSAQGEGTSARLAVVCIAVHVLVLVLSVFAYMRLRAEACLALAAGMTLGLAACTALAVRRVSPGGEGTAPVPIPSRRARLFGVSMAAWLLAGVLVALWLLSPRPAEAAPEIAGTAHAVAASVALILAFAFYVLSSYARRLSRESETESFQLALWLSNSQWLLIAGGLGTGLRATRLAVYAGYLAVAMRWWLLALCAELAFHLLWRLVRPPAERMRRPAVRLFLLEALFAFRNPVVGLTRSIESYFGVDVAASWTFRVVRRSLEPLVLFLVGVLWLMSCLVTVQVDEVGVKTRFGRRLEGVLGPGLHLKYPWPVERVQTCPAAHVMTTITGFKSQGGPTNFIWTKMHGQEEYRFVLGDGRELISIDAAVFWRIKDPIAYVYHCQNPDQAIEALAYRTTTLEAVPLTLDQMLARDREHLSDTLRTQLQEAVNGEGLGIEIVEVALLAIHPPLEVASAYEEIVSSELAKQTQILSAQAERESDLPTEEALAKRRVAKATSERNARVSSATGESLRFTKMAEVFREAPDLFRARRHLEALTEALEKRRLLIIDDRLYEGNVETWFDLGGSAPFRSQTPPSLETFMEEEED